MRTVPVNTDAAFTIPFADDDGNAVTPTSATYTVVDGEGNTVVIPTAITISGPSAAITIAAVHNSAAGARSIVLTMMTTAGTVFSETVYGVVNRDRLVFLQNSFQTYAQALFVARDLSGVDSFTGASKADQSVALIEAFRRLIQINYFIPWPELVDVQDYLLPRYDAAITPLMWPYMTEDLFARYPAVFRAALCNAQISEASVVLAGDPLGDKVRSGLLAWSVGESKMMFRSGVGPLNSRVSRQSMNYLKGYIDSRVTLTRS